MILDHIGIAVKSIEKGITHWETVFGYRQSTEIVVNTRQKARVVFLTKNHSLPIKLFEPTEESSPAYSFAKKGGGLHHLCFSCENLENQIKSLQEKRLRLLSPPEPGEAFDNENIAFLYGGQGINIELIDTDKRAKLLSENTTSTD